MVAGHSRTGKTSFIHTLYEALPVKKLHFPSSTTSDGSASPVVAPADAQFPFPPIDIHAPTPAPAGIEFDQGHEKVLLRLIDTPGVPIPVNVHKATPAEEEVCISLADSHASSLVGYLEAQFEATLLEESKVRRNPKSPDYQTHACLYLLDPHVCLASRGLTLVDRRLLGRLCLRVNVIICLAKSDLLTVRQLRALRSYIQTDVAKHKIPIYAFPDEIDDDDEDGDGGVDPDVAELNAQLRGLLPFALVNAEDTEEFALDGDAPANGKGAGPRQLARTYPWGSVEVENPEHCDFLQIKNTLFATHMQELKDYTREVHYEQWRTEKLLEVRSTVMSKRDGNSSRASLSTRRTFEE
ncbi:hypothetical protein HDV00_009489 [Rhizophlyctis rosea]|nr:hypothetical protein HDV00_009489 [Rhizophlyctis rosea]